MIKKPKFVLKYVDGLEEGLNEFYVNDVQVGSADHDSHGWEGMAEARRMFEGIAAQLGVEVQEVYVE